MSDKDGILKFMGLAMRAGKIVSGMDAVLAELRAGRVKLLILAEDISFNSLEKILNVIEKNGLKDTEAFRFATGEELGAAIGKSDRAVIAITEQEFAKRLSEMLEEY